MGDARADFDLGRGGLKGDEFQIGPYATWAYEKFYVDALVTLAVNATELPYVDGFDEAVTVVYVAPTGVNTT